MHEAQDRRVERQPRRARQERSAGLAAMRAVTRDRMTEPGEMQPDLMRAAGLEHRGDQRRAAQALERRHMRDRALALDRAIDGLRRDLPDHDRAVLALDIVGLEQLAERLVRVPRAGKYQEPARGQIDAMDEVDLAELLAQEVE